MLGMAGNGRFVWLHEQMKKFLQVKAALEFFFQHAGLIKPAATFEVPQ